MSPFRRQVCSRACSFRADGHGHGLIACIAAICCVRARRSNHCCHRAPCRFSTSRDCARCISASGRAGPSSICSRQIHNGWRTGTHTGKPTRYLAASPSPMFANAYVRGCGQLRMVLDRCWSARMPAACARSGPSWPCAVPRTPLRCRCHTLAPWWFGSHLGRPGRLWTFSALAMDVRQAASAFVGRLDRHQWTMYGRTRRRLRWTGHRRRSIAVGRSLWARGRNVMPSQRLGRCHSTVP